MLWILFGVSILVFLTWSGLEFTWLQTLRSANGTRPFVVTTLRVGHVFLIESTIMMFVPIAYLHTDHSLVFFVALIAHRTLSLLAAWAMWELHGLIVDLGNTVHKAREAEGK